jgi:hypothetical protein
MTFKLFELESRNAGQWRSVKEGDKQLTVLCFQAFTAFNG